MQDMEQMSGWIQTQVAQKSRQAEAQKRNLYFYILSSWHINKKQLVEELGQAMQMMQLAYLTWNHYLLKIYAQSILIIA